jgi:hypothetical protein
MILNQNISQSLMRISQWGRNFCPENVIWKAGMKDHEINELIEGFPFFLPRELISFYQCDRSDIDISPEFCSIQELSNNLDYCLCHWLPDRIPHDIDISPEFCSVQKLSNNLEHYLRDWRSDRNSNNAFASLGKRYLNFYKGCFENELYKEVIGHYPLDWCEFPIGCGDAGEVYFVRVYKHETEISPIWVRFRGEEPVEYGSNLENLMLTFAECYETGAYYPVWIKDDDVECWDIEMNLEEVETIFEKYNPHQIDTWRMINIG